MKNYFFFVDDNIWVFRDLTLNGGKSLFDNAYLKIFKDMYEQYGTKTQLNVFYTTDEGDFNLSQMTDRYKEEWIANAHWLKLAFHANSEHPDFPFINSTYDEIKNDYEKILKEIRRFAGEECISHDVITHWVSASKGACEAFRDCGAVLVDASRGKMAVDDSDIGYLPDDQKEILMHNRENSPHTFPFCRVMGGGELMPFIRSYNHLSDDQAEDIKGTNIFYYDEETGIYFKCSTDITLNLYEPDHIVEILDTFDNYEFIGMCIHEQYFYEEYMNYQPNYREKIETAIKHISEKCYKSVWMNELLK